MNSICCFNPVDACDSQVLGHTESKIWELHPGLPWLWQGPKALSHHLLNINMLTYEQVAGSAEKAGLPCGKLACFHAWQLLLQSFSYCMSWFPCPLPSLPHIFPMLPRNPRLEENVHWIGPEFTFWLCLLPSLWASKSLYLSGTLFPALSYGELV